MCSRSIDDEVSRVMRKPALYIWENKYADVTVQPGFCQIWSEIPKTGFLITRLKCRFCVCMLIEL